MRWTARARRGRRVGRGGGIVRNRRTIETLFQQHGIAGFDAGISQRNLGMNDRIDDKAIPAGQCDADPANAMQIRYLSPPASDW